MTGTRSKPIDRFWARERQFMNRGSSTAIGALPPLAARSNGGIGSMAAVPMRCYVIVQVPQDRIPFRIYKRHWIADIRDLVDRILTLKK